MLERFSTFCLTAIALGAWPAVAQSPSNPHIPLCELQANLTEGAVKEVRVEGVYVSGLEGQYLVTSDCSGRSTYIEFQLKTHRRWKQLVNLSNRTNTKKHVSGDGDPILVVFEGKFYGPPVPGPKLPEAFRKNYHPGWDPMGVSMTKMVVYAIEKVQPLPTGHPCAPSDSDPQKWPCFQGPASHSTRLSRSATSGIRTFSFVVPMVCAQA